MKKNTLNYDAQEIIVNLLLDKSIHNSKLELLLEEIFLQELLMNDINLFLNILFNTIIINKDDLYKKENSFSIILFYKKNIVKYDIITICRDWFESTIEEIYNDIMEKQIKFNKLEKFYHLIWKIILWKNLKEYFSLLNLWLYN